MTKAILSIILAFVSVSAVCQGLTNQDLHTQQDVEYLIVCNEKFISQAAEIADLHPELKTLVVADRQVYSEFSSGKREASAIRDLARHLFGNHGKLRYLLLLGDGSPCNTLDTKGNTNLLPTCLVNSIMTDDYYGILQEGNTGKLDIGVGRIPVKNTQEADIAVSKLRQYIRGGNTGHWRKRILFVADDENQNLHAQQSDHLAERVEGGHPEFDITKLYIDAHKQESSAVGNTYPTVNEAIKSDIERGTLIINYTGHGGMRFLADERILTTEEIDSLQNISHLPLVITASCNVGYFDCYDSIADRATDSPAEHFLHNPKGGAIALIAPTREVLASQNFMFNNNLFDHLLESQLALGDIVRLAKNSISGSQKHYYALLGDPALRLPIPENRMYLESINGMPVGSYKEPLRALGKYTLTGIVEESGKYENGTAFVIIRDKRTLHETLNNDGEGAFEYQDFGNIIHKGRCSIRNGEFSFTFIVPKDIDYSPGNIKISLYASNSDNMASGFYKDFTLEGSIHNPAADCEGPEISISISGIGQYTRDAVMQARLTDHSGINVTATPGHAIELIVDGVSATDITDIYEPDPGSHQSGTVTYNLGALPDGIHTIKLKAWDNLNNPSEKEFTIAISGGNNLEIISLNLYPNPFSERAVIRFGHNAIDGVEYHVRIYTTGGKLICGMSGMLEYGEGGIQISGDQLPIANGVYIYRLTIRDREGRTASQSGKFVYMR